MACEQPENGGAQGLLDAPISALSGVDTSKMCGITTDGESANTGKDAGLWKLASEHYQRRFLTVWCVGHRSDLAMESVKDSVSEIELWLTNTKSLTKYFRTSAAKTKLLRSNMAAAKHFHKCLDVRFAEHLGGVIEATLHNQCLSSSVGEDTG